MKSASIWFKRATAWDLASLGESCDAVFLILTKQIFTPLVIEQRALSVGSWKLSHGFVHSHSSERMIETLRVPKETCSKEAAGASEFASALVVDVDVSESPVEDAGLSVCEASVEGASVDGASVEGASVAGASV